VDPRPRLPLHIQGLGRREDDLRAWGHRDGVSPYHRVRNRACIPKRPRHWKKTRPDVGLGRLLPAASCRKNGGRCL